MSGEEVGIKTRSREGVQYGRVKPEEDSIRKSKRDVPTEGGSGPMAYRLLRGLVS